MFKKLRKNQSGITAIVIALVVTLACVALLIPIGLQLTATIYSAVSNLVLGTTGNATRTAVFNNVWSAYSLSAVVPIVAAAGLIIGVVVAAFSFSGRRR